MPRQQRRLIVRGGVWDARIPAVGTHPVVVLTRDSAIPVLRSLVCGLVTSTFHGHVAEVEVGSEEGLRHACAINCDSIFTLPKQVLVRHRGQLGPVKLAQLDRALAIAIGLA